MGTLIFVHNWNSDLFIFYRNTVGPVWRFFVASLPLCGDVNAREISLVLAMLATGWRHETRKFPCGPVGLLRTKKIIQFIRCDLDDGKTSFGFKTSTAHVCT